MDRAILPLNFNETRPQVLEKIVTVAGLLTCMQFFTCGGSMPKCFANEYRYVDCNIPEFISKT